MTATVQDVLSNPVPDITVRLAVTGSVNTTGSQKTDANGQATTSNTTYYATTKTISWRATFASTNDVGSGSPSHCETMSVNTLNNDTGS